MTTLIVMIMPNATLVVPLFLEVNAFHLIGGHAAGAVEEHTAIYRAIREGDGAAAARAAAVHLDRTLEDYRREIRRRVFDRRSVDE
jgi:DNA-binding GntR family transcriptional regulator